MDYITAFFTSKERAEFNSTFKYLSNLLGNRSLSQKYYLTYMFNIDREKFYRQIITDYNSCFDKYIDSGIIDIEGIPCACSDFSFEINMFVRNQSYGLYKQTVREIPPLIKQFKNYIYNTKRNVFEPAPEIDGILNPYIRGELVRNYPFLYPKMSKENLSLFDEQTKLDKLTLEKQKDEVRKEREKEIELSEEIRRFI